MGNAASITRRVTEPHTVVAIDIGTTLSGYAFCINSSRHRILTGRHGGLLEDVKVPTVVLLNADFSFNSFGHQAQQIYGELSAKERKDFYYIDRCTSALGCFNKLTKESTVKDSQNKNVNAFHVFTLVIKYFSDLAIKHIRLNTKAHLSKKDIQWVLTIPTARCETLSQFLREAAKKAGIREKKIRLVLKTDAAVRYSFQNEELITTTNHSTVALPSGHKFILANLGGATTDVCVYEKGNKGNLIEIYHGISKNSAGKSVNMAFISFLQDLIGRNTWQLLTDKHTSVYIDLIADFERKKQIFSLTGGESIIIRIQESMVKKHLSRTNESLEQRIQRSQYKNDVTYLPHRKRMIIHKKLADTFFQPAADHIVIMLQNATTACPDHKLQTLVLTGGFSESPYIRDSIAVQFPHLRIITTKDASCTALKGAVGTGSLSNDISVIQRRSKFTYGFRYAEKFNPKIHPRSLKSTIDGKEWCVGLFGKLIETGQMLQKGDMFTIGGYCSAKRHDRKYVTRYTELWKSERKNPKYCFSEPGQEDCKLLAVLQHDPPTKGWPDYSESKTQLIVGETELTVKYSNQTTGEQYQTSVDFM